MKTLLKALRFLLHLILFYIMAFYLSSGLFYGCMFYINNYLTQKERQNIQEFIDQAGHLGDLLTLTYVFMWIFLIVLVLSPFLWILSGYVLTKILHLFRFISSRLLQRPTA